MPRKNHFIPAFILRNFKEPKFKANISYLIKDTSQIEQRNITSFNKYYNIKAFYSRDSLKTILTSINPSIEINPLFVDLENDLENELSKIELRASQIFQKIINNSDIELSNDEINFVKEYIIIQHLRTKKFMEDFSNFPFDFPEDFEESLIEEVEMADVDIKKIIKQENPQKNSAERREIYRQFLKFRKKNPQYRTRMLTEQEISQAVEEARANFNAHFNSDNSHTLFIIKKKSRDDFIELVKMNQLNMTILLNYTSELYNLPDAGVIISREANSNYKITLPIHPKISIVFSDSDFKKQQVSIESVKEFNRLCKDESMFVVFGNKSSLENY